MRVAALYDLDRAAEPIRTSSWPQAEQIAAENVLTVPAADEAIDVLERMAATGSPVL